MNKYLGSEKIIEMKKEYLCPPSFNHFYQNPPQIVRGEGQYLYDDQGKQYLDFFSGVSVMNCGHCNKEILERTIEQMQTLQHTSIIYLTQPMVELAQRLSEVLPGNIKRSFFCCTGSEANETALLMAKLYTGKSEFIALQNGLHGRTYMTMSATAIPMWRIDPDLANTVHFAPTVWSLEGNEEEAMEVSLKAIEKIILERGQDKIAALITEPIQGNGGILTPPKEYFKKLKKLLEKYEILLIVDEVQTGFARTGKMFAIEHYDIVPDIMTVAKALGNGMPISATCTTDEIGMAFNKPSASTLGGNPVCASTALAVLDFIQSNDLCQRAEELGNRLITGLQKLQEKYTLIKQVRGIGLMVGVELRHPAGQAASREVDQILEELKDQGIILGKNGLERNVLAFQPPLVIEQEDVDRILGELESILEKIS